MLTRQKCILYMLRLAARPVSRKELIKWCFLLRHETPTGGGDAFYRFLPYKYGPFSFGMYRDIDKLAKADCVEEPDDSHWSLGPGASVAKSDLPRDIGDDVSRIVEQFSRRTVNGLLEYVYDHYPYFTMNSLLKQKTRRPVAEPAVHTIGYEGLQIDALLNHLIERGIRLVIDVRKNPIARRYGFHKSTLSRLCNCLGIEYVHLPQLGILSQDRQSLSSLLDYQKLFLRYERETLAKEDESLTLIASRMTDKPAALLCMEADPAYCHRTIVARHVAASTSLPIEHLEAEANGSGLC